METNSLNKKIHKYRSFLYFLAFILFVSLLLSIIKYEFNLIVAFGLLLNIIYCCMVVALIQYSHKNAEVGFYNLMVYSVVFFIFSNFEIMQSSFFIKGFIVIASTKAYKICKTGDDKQIKS